MEENIKTAIANIDKVISSVSMTRKEHATLAQNIELLVTVGKEYVELKDRDNEAKTDEPAN